MTTDVSLSATLPGSYDARFGPLSRRLAVTSYATPPLWCVEISGRYGTRTPFLERCHYARDYAEAARVAHEWANAEGATLREVARTVVT